MAFASVACAAQRPPNVIIILSDDQGYPDLGCIGTKPILTPNLDRLAAEGVRGTNFYVAWNACTPSRSSILTGRYPQRNGLYDMIRNDMVDYGHHYTPEEYAVSPEMTLGLDVREITFGDVLTRAGYACGAVGKWDMVRRGVFCRCSAVFSFSTASETTVSTTTLTNAMACHRCSAGTRAQRKTRARM
jgi:arylsulfatase A-like enzyme